MSILTKTISRLFASRPTTPTSKPTTRGGLFTDQAVGSVLGELFGLSDPDDVLRKAGLTRSSLRALEGDDEINAALETRLSGTLTAPWRLDPYDATMAPFIEEELWRLMEHALTGAWSAVPYGYSVVEAVYARRPAGRIGLAELNEKPFEWFRPLSDGGLMYQAPGKPAVAVDTRFKFFVTRRRPTFVNPYGQALLSRAYWPWFMRNAGWRAWARFLERTAAPLLIGKTAGDKKAMAEALADAALSGSVAVGHQDDVETIAGTSAGEAFNRFGEAVDRRIQKLILGQTLTTDVQGGGSYAAAAVHDRVRQDRIDADTRMLRGTFQRIVDALVALNWPGATAPTFYLGAEKGLEKDRAERDVKLVTAGIVKLSEKYLMDRYDFDQGDFTVPPGGPVVPGVAQAAMPSAAGQFAAAADAGLLSGQHILDAVAGDAFRMASDPIDPRVIREAIRQATDADDLTERLAGILASHPPAEFRAIMERALWAADVMGYVHADDGD